MGKEHENEKQIENEKSAEQKSGYCKKKFKSEGKFQAWEDNLEASRTNQEKKTTRKKQIIWQKKMSSWGTELKIGAYACFLLLAFTLPVMILLVNIVVN